jgi:hypothetical protein
MLCVVYLCIIAKKFNYDELYGCTYLACTGNTETLVSTLHSTRSTDLACTQLKVLKHYYPGYNLLDFEPGGAWITGHDEFVIEISKGKK